MTQPTDQPTTEQQRRVQRGGRTTLETRKQIRGQVVTATAARMVVQFRGTADLDEQITQLGPDVQPYLVFTVAHAKVLSDVALVVFVDTPDADAQTPVTSKGFAGSVAFFEHDGHGQAPFRVPLNAALRRIGARQNDLTATFAPVALPGRSRGRDSLTINAVLHLTRSKVER